MTPPLTTKTITTPYTSGGHAARPAIAATCKQSDPSRTATGRSPGVHSAGIASSSSGWLWSSFQTLELFSGSGSRIPRALRRQLSEGEQGHGREHGITGKQRVLVGIGERRRRQVAGHRCGDRRRAVRLHQWRAALRSSRRGSDTGTPERCRAERGQGQGQEASSAVGQASTR